MILPWGTRYFTRRLRQAPGHGCHCNSCRHFALHKYNEIYKHGNDNEINQIDVIEAEKNTQIDSNNLDEYEIGTHRTRVVAFLTQDQMLLSDMFDSQPDAYYIDMVKAKMDENLKYKK